MFYLTTQCAQMWQFLASSASKVHGPLGRYCISYKLSPCDIEAQIREIFFDPFPLKPSLELFHKVPEEAILLPQRRASGMSNGMEKPT